MSYNLEETMTYACKFNKLNCEQCVFFDVDEEHPAVPGRGGCYYWCLLKSEYRFIEGDNNVVCE